MIHEAQDPIFQEIIDAVPTVPGGLRMSEPLCAAQMRIQRLGFVEVQPIHCLRGAGYYYLRNTSNLGNTHPAGREQYATIEEAIEGALRWAAIDPARRQVIASHHELERAS
jgi:hypothetical protein